MPEKSSIHSLSKRSMKKKRNHHKKVRVMPYKRKQIPQRIRKQVWEIYHPRSSFGYCYCCKDEFHVLDSWHAGHIVAQSHGGSDTADNLRPLCPSCNMSMGTQHMDTYKARYFPDDFPLWLQLIL